MAAYKVIFFLFGWNQRLTIFGQYFKFSVRNSRALPIKWVSKPFHYLIQFFKRQIQRILWFGCSYIQHHSIQRHSIKITNIINNKSINKYLYNRRHVSRSRAQKPAGHDARRTKKRTILSHLGMSTALCVHLYKMRLYYYLFNMLLIR